MQVACGAFHTVALTAVGGVYAAGKDSTGPSKPTFRPVQGALAGLRADEIACGDAHTAVVAAQRRRLYTWGIGASGRLGHGDMVNCDLPKLVEQLHDRELRQVVCGPQCTAVVCSCPQLSIEQKAALARSHDSTLSADAGRSSNAPIAAVERPAAAAAPPAKLAPLADAPTRGALLALAAQGGGGAPGRLHAGAPEWRTRTLEAELHAMRLGLRQAREDAQALRAQLDASQALVAQLTSRLDDAGLRAHAEAAAFRDEKPHAAGADAALPRGEAAAAESGSVLPSAPEQAPSAHADHTTHEVEPGVFVTVNAGRVLRRVRFDRRTFTDEQAQEWWENNRDAVMSRLGLVLPSARSHRPAR